MYMHVQICALKYVYVYVYVSLYPCVYHDTNMCNAILVCIFAYACIGTSVHFDICPGKRYRLAFMSVHLFVLR